MAGVGGNPDAELISHKGAVTVVVAKVVKILVNILNGLLRDFPTAGVVVENIVLNKVGDAHAKHGIDELL